MKNFFSSKLMMSTLFLVILLTVTASTVIVSADSTEEIRFNAVTAGPCYVIYGEVPPPPLPMPFPLSLAIGRGVTRIGGHAEDLSLMEITPLFLEPGYKSEIVEALGIISVIWTDNDVTHRLSVRFCSTADTGYSYFVSNNGFSVPAAGEVGTGQMLMFTGIHDLGSETKEILGEGLVLTIPTDGTVVSWLFADPENPENPAVGNYVNWVTFVNEDDTHYALMWFSDEIKFLGSLISEVFGPIDPRYYLYEDINIPGASVFLCDVKEA